MVRMAGLAFTKCRLVSIIKYVDDTECKAPGGYTATAFRENMGDA